MFESPCPSEPTSQIHMGKRLRCAVDGLKISGASKCRKREKVWNWAPCRTFGLCWPFSGWVRERRWEGGSERRCGGDVGVCDEVCKGKRKRRRMPRCRISATQHTLRLVHGHANARTRNKRVCEIPSAPFANLRLGRTQRLWRWVCQRRTFCSTSPILERLIHVNTNLKHHCPGLASCVRGIDASGLIPQKKERKLGSD